MALKLSNLKNYVHADEPEHYGIENFEFTAHFNIDNLTDNMDVINNNSNYSLEKKTEFFNKVNSLKTIKELITANGVNASVMESLSQINPDIITDEKPLFCYTTDFSSVNIQYALECIDETANKLFAEFLK